VASAQNEKATYLSKNIKNGSSNFGLRKPCGWQNFMPKHVGITEDRDVVFIVFALAVLVCLPRVLPPSRVCKQNAMCIFPSSIRAAL